MLRGRGYLTDLIFWGIIISEVCNKTRKIYGSLCLVSISIPSSFRQASSQKSDKGSHLIDSIPY